MKKNKKKIANKLLLRRIRILNSEIETLKQILVNTFDKEAKILHLTNRTLKKSRRTKSEK